MSWLATILLARCHTAKVSCCAARLAIYVATLYHFDQAVGCTDYILDVVLFLLPLAPHLHVIMFLKMQRMVQVEVKYEPPVTLSTQGAAVTQVAAIAVVSGAAHAPSLPAHAVTGCSCFNVGPAAQRMITPAALLTLVDR